MESVVGLSHALPKVDDSTPQVQPVVPLEPPGMSEAESEADSSEAEEEVHASEAEAHTMPETEAEEDTPEVEVDMPEGEVDTLEDTRADMLEYHIGGRDRWAAKPDTVSADSSVKAAAFNQRWDGKPTANNMIDVDDPPRQPMHQDDFVLQPISHHLSQDYKQNALSPERGQGDDCAEDHVSLGCTSPSPDSSRTKDLIEIESKNLNLTEEDDLEKALEVLRGRRILKTLIPHGDLKLVVEQAAHFFYIVTSATAMAEIKKSCDLILWRSRNSKSRLALESLVALRKWTAWVQAFSLRFGFSEY